MYVPPLLLTTLHSGTHLYCAPEVTAGLPFSWQTDIYAFGVTVWASAVPLSVLTEMEAAQDNFALTPASVAPSLWPLIEQCTHAKLLHRPNMVTVLSELGDLPAEQGAAKKPRK